MRHKIQKKLNYSHFLKHQYNLYIFTPNDKLFFKFYMTQIVMKKPIMTRVSIRFLVGVIIFRAPKWHSVNESSELKLHRTSKLQSEGNSFFRITFNINFWNKKLPIKIVKNTVNRLIKCWCDLISYIHL